MATLTLTNLETHPDGTLGAAAIINTNWSRLEDIFTPALSSSDDSYEAFWRAFVRSASDPTSQGSAALWDASQSKPAWREGFASVAYAATVAIDGEGAMIQQIGDLTGDLEFLSLTNQAAGGKVTVMLEADGTGPHTLTFPSGWVFLGAAAPASLAASKKARLELEFTGGTDADVVARYSAEP